MFTSPVVHIRVKKTKAATNSQSAFRTKHKLIHTYTFFAISGHFDALHGLSLGLGLELG